MTCISLPASANGDILLCSLNSPLNQVTAADFDLTPISFIDLSNHQTFREVAACIVGIQQLPNYHQTLEFRWINPSNQVIFRNAYNIECGNQYLTYYTYIGYVPWEIWNTGSYKVEIVTNGEITSIIYYEVY